MKGLNPVRGLALASAASLWMCPASAKAAQAQQAPLPEGLVAPDAKASVAALVCFLEGPAVDENENVFFSETQFASWRLGGFEWSARFGGDVPGSEPPGSWHVPPEYGDQEERTIRLVCAVYRP